MFSSHAPSSIRARHRAELFARIASAQLAVSEEEYAAEYLGWGRKRGGFTGINSARVSAPKHNASQPSSYTTAWRFWRRYDYCLPPR